MRQFSSAFLAIPFALALGASSLSAQAEAVHNGAATPTCCAWVPYGVGWTYTPTQNFTLTSVETRFGLYEGETPAYPYTQRNVVVSVWSAPNGVLLRSGSFASSPSDAAWVGSSFGGLNLLAGTSYFFSWENVSDVGPGYLGVNATRGAPSGEWSTFRYEQDGTTTFFADGEQFDPIVRFNSLAAGPGSVTPEPATLTLLATGLVGMVGARRRKKLLS